MSRATVVAFLLTAAAALPVSAAEPTQIVIVCRSAGCDFLPVATFTVNGRDSLRLLPLGQRDVSEQSAKGAPEVKIANIGGLYRDPANGSVFVIDQRMESVALALPEKSDLPTGSPAAFWSRATLQYRTDQTSKTASAVPVPDFAFLLSSTTSLDAVSRVFDRELGRNNANPRHRELLGGAVRFAARPTSGPALREAIVRRVQTLVDNFERQSGDPTLLADVIGDAVLLAGFYQQTIGPLPDAALAERAERAHSAFQTRLQIATALRDAGYADEYLTKLGQLGLAQWSISNITADLRNAITKAAETHRQRATKLSAEGHFDAAFDEARRAAAIACDPSVGEEFYSTRVLFTNHNAIPRAPDYTARDKAVLEQLVRELEQLDTSKEQLTLDRIRRGEELNPTFLPLESKKAEFLDKLGRYREALEVVQRIERSVRLDPKQLEEFLRLDGRISNNLADAVQKSSEQAAAQFAAGDFKAALTTAETGLRADPSRAALLKTAALSAAFIRQRERAQSLTTSFLKQNNLGCVSDEDVRTMLDLNRELQVTADIGRGGEAAGIPHWISGVHYAASEAYYDPISLGFLQPVFRITSEDGVFTTLFVREDRSIMVRTITTTIAEKANSTLGTRSVLFEAEPRYDRDRAAMLEIGSRATSVGERVAYPLVYWNSPALDPALVARFTGKQTTRGWAGNPYFHPFIWSGIYTFDLTYDRLGRVIRATPRQPLNGQRSDPLSEPLDFVWQGDSNRLLSIRGINTGYLRELRYDKDGRLRSEEISTKAGSGSINYEYAGDGHQLKEADIEDGFWDRKHRHVYFDSGQR